MKHIALVMTSYPDTVAGGEAAGSFVEDMAKALSREVRVIVIGPGTRNQRTTKGPLSVERYYAPRQPLSLLDPKNPRHWHAIFVTLRNGFKAVDVLAR